MILQIKNVAEYDQPITLHTGEAKTIESEVAIQVNTGADRRLINYYASLVNYNFDVTVSLASDQERNSFEDALAGFRAMRERADRERSLKDRGVYPASSDPYKSGPVEPRKPYNPKTLLDDDNSVVESIKRVLQTPAPTPRAESPVVMDSKLGEVVPDFSPQLPDDYPEDPRAEAELKRIEAQEEKVRSEQESTDAKWYKLNELDEEVLKKVLLDKFEENTKLRSKSKIIYHIIELADENGMNIYELVDEYK